MRALAFPERTAPGASLILDLRVRAVTVAHPGLDDEDAARLTTSAIRIARRGRSDVLVLKRRGCVMLNQPPSAFAPNAAAIPLSA